MAGRWLETDSLSNQNISSALAIGAYTADADRLVICDVFLDQVAGGGDYIVYMTKQLGGAGSHGIVGPKTTITAAAGETALAPQAIVVTVRTGDVLTVYVDGLAGDTTTPDTTMRWFELAALQPTTAGRTLDVSATGEAGLDWSNVGSPTTTVALTGTQINSVSGTVSANVVQIDGETTPVDNLVLALGTGGLVEKLNSMLEAAGLAYRFTAEALAEGPSGGGSSGSGTGTYTDTIAVGATPLDGVRVQLSTDSAGSNRVYETYTNALGVFTMNPDPGTYYRWLDLAGYDFAQGVAVVVT